jgi:hypothetical protein
MGTRLIGGGVLVALVALAGAPAAVGKAPSAERQADTRLALLVKHIGDLPAGAVKRSDKAALLRQARAARKVATRDPCRAARTLQAGKFRAFSEALSARAALMVTRRSLPCGGVAKANVTEVKPVVLESSERRLRLRLLLPTPTFTSYRARGARYMQMLMEGMGDSGKQGQPVMPALATFFGIPEGANVSVRVNDTNGFDLNGVNLYPRQPDPVDRDTPPPGAPPDSDFQADPFVKSRSAYASNRPFPARASKASDLGKMRELRIGGVDAAGGQYRPRSKKLHVFTQLDVTVRFGGANKGTFAKARRLQSVWESYFTRNYEAMLVNWKTIQGKLGVDDLSPAFCGEDMLIVTSPALQPAANAFAAARQDAGYVTRVALVGSDPGQIGTTLAQIQAYILGELNSDCEMRPSYVVLFGDTSHVPTWHPPCAENGDPAECSIPSDLPYSLNFPSDLFADVQLGRIPAHDLDAANAVVNKIVGYETTKPADPATDDFFGHATVTAYFEQRLVCILNEGESGEPNCKAKNGPVTGHYVPDYDDHRDGRGFTKTAERIQNTMAQQYGHTVDRVYTKGDDPQVIPEEYYDGTPIPPNLLLPGFPWNGTGADLLNHYNDGRFAILHRDHGWNYGWANPYLTTSDTPSLNNGTQLPVVFGVDCASGTFDIPGSPSFVETQVMKPDGGAVAGFGDTQVSPTWPNNHMALGFFDAPFPLLLPSFGSETPTKRLGDILLSGKGYMASQNDGAAEYQEHYLYHLLGDPSGQMWSNDPIDIDVTKIDVKLIPIPVPDPGGPAFKVLVDMGGLPAVQNTVVTLYRNSGAIGRGIVGAGGSVEITPEVATPSDGLKVEFEQDGALPDEKAIDGTPPPPAGPADTSMGIQCPSDPSFGTPATVRGHLDPAFAGAPVRLTYTKAGAGGRSFESTVMTNASGDWTDTQTFPRGDRGAWTVNAAYAGDASHKPSSAECDFTVR